MLDHNGKNLIYSIVLIYMLSWAVESTVICFYQNHLVAFCRNCHVLMELLQLIIIDLCDKSKSSKSHILNTMIYKK